MLSVSFVNISLQNNVFAKCVLKSSVQGGNAYGGAVSLYIGAYSSMYSSNSNAVAAVGDTVVRNVNINLGSSQFNSCTAIRDMNTNYFFRGANVYGGSFSFYIGSYAWSQSYSSSDSNSMCGSTNASNVTVFVQNISSFDSRAAISNSLGLSYGVNSYGGSMSVLYVGAYSWSYSRNGYSYSACGATSSMNILVHVNGSICYDCSARSMVSTRNTLGANSYGGSLSVFYVGAYSWSYSEASFKSCNSTCGLTSASELSIHVVDSACSNCSSSSTVGGRFSNGANSYGGSMSVVYIGAYLWSWSDDASSNSNSTCADTIASEVSVHISNFTCINCSAISSSKLASIGANVYGGSISAFFIGAYAYSYAAGAEKILACSIVGATKLNNFLIMIKNTTISFALASSS
jgi:hypothetical protein